MSAKWLNGKWVKKIPQALEDGKVYTKMKPTAHNAETVKSPLVSDVSSKRLPGDIKYSVFSKAKDEKIDVDVTSGKMLTGGIRYNIKNNGKRIGFVN